MAAGIDDIVTVERQSAGKVLLETEAYTIVALCEHQGQDASGGCPLMRLARLEGIAANPWAAAYARSISCDFNQAVLTEMLWDMADEVRTDLAGKQPQVVPSPELPLFC